MRTIRHLTRRQAMLGLGGVVAAPMAAQAQQAPAGPMCVVVPEQTAGPFYIDPKLVRSDITEMRAGLPLRVALTIVEAGPCTPIQGARVDLWHADAMGLYSGFPGQSDDGNVTTEGETFLRGTQMADSRGAANFRTIYPGWYPGRTAHIHVRVFLGDRLAATSQFYFPETINDYVYGNIAPYNTRTRPRDTTNATDRILLDAGGKPIADFRQDGADYVASLTVGVQRNPVATPPR